MAVYNKSEVAREYRTKHGAEMPTAKLARIMYDETKSSGIFKDVEDARIKLRYIEGKNGVKNRKKLQVLNFR